MSQRIITRRAELQIEIVLSQRMLDLDSSVPFPYITGEGTLGDQLSGTAGSYFVTLGDRSLGHSDQIWDSG